MAEILDEIPDDDTERVIEYSGGYESFLGSLVFGGFESDSDDGDDESSEESDEQDSNEPTRDEPTRDEQKEQLKKKKDLEESQSEDSQSEESQSDELESELVEKEVELVSEFVGGQTKKAKKQESTRQTEHNEVVSREAKHNEDVSQEAKHNEDDSEFLDKPCGCSSEIVAEDQEDVVNSEFLSEDPDLGDKPVSVNQEKMEMLKELVNDNPDTSSEDELDSEYVKSEEQTKELNHEQTQEPNTKEPSDSDSESSSESDTGSVQITKELPKKQPKKGGNPTVFAALQSYLN